MATSQHGEGELCHRELEVFGVVTQSSKASELTSKDTSSLMPRRIGRGTRVADDLKGPFERFVEDSQAKSTVVDANECTQEGTRAIWPGSLTPIKATIDVLVRGKTVPGEKVIDVPSSVCMAQSLRRVLKEQSVDIGSLSPVKGEGGYLWGRVGSHWQTNLLVANNTILREEVGVVDYEGELRNKILHSQSTSRLNLGPSKGAVFTRGEVHATLVKTACIADASLYKVFVASKAMLTPWAL